MDIVTPVKPYMLILFLIFPFLLTRVRLRFYSISLVAFPGLLFVYIISTFLYADNTVLVLIRAIGIILLILTFISLILLSSIITAEMFYEFIRRFIVFYLVFSLCYYILGLEAFLNGGITLENGERKLFGLYMEGVLPRLRGGADSPNNFVLLLIFLNVSYFMCCHLLNKVISYNILILSILSLILTLSITGYLAFFCILLFVSLDNSKLFFTLLLFTLLSIITISLLYFSQDWFQNIVSTRVLRIGTGSGREGLFIYVIDLIGQNPIFGYGLGQARDFLVGFQGRQLQSTHNSFLEIFFEGGIFALILFVICWFTLFARIIISKCSLFSKKMLFLYLSGLLIFSQANLMIYVELMVLNLFGVVFLVRLAEIFGDASNQLK